MLDQDADDPVTKGRQGVVDDLALVTGFLPMPGLENDRRAESFYDTGASLNDGGFVAFDINFNEVQPVDLRLLAKGIKGRRGDGRLKPFLQIDRQARTPDVEKIAFFLETGERRYPITQGSIIMLRPS